MLRINWIPIMTSLHTSILQYQIYTSNDSIDIQVWRRQLSLRALGVSTLLCLGWCYVEYNTNYCKSHNYGSVSEFVTNIIISNIYPTSSFSSSSIIIFLVLHYCNCSASWKITVGCINCNVQMYQLFTWSISPKFDW